MKRLLLLLFTIATATVTDIDGNVYETVQIGDQLWMAENLKVTRFNNENTINTIYEIWDWPTHWSGEPSQGIYDDNWSNTYTYGKLYNWLVIGDEREVCPEDWHVPTDDEWNELIEFLGGAEVAGGKLKESGTIHWNSPNSGATNESGFSALPGGFANPSFGYYQLGLSGFYWSSTELNNSTASSYKLEYANSMISNSSVYKITGISIRCMQNIGGDIQGCMDIDACNYNEFATFDDNTCEFPDFGYNCENECILGFDCNGICGGESTIEDCVECAGEGISEGECNCYGDVLDSCGQCGGGIENLNDCIECIDYDGNSYEMVKIGGQLWMTENLKVTHFNNGDEIPTGFDNSDWENLTSPAYAVYMDSLEYADIYGNIYNWYAVNDDRGICPDGWSAPSDDDFKLLELYLGMNQIHLEKSGYNRGSNEGSKISGDYNLWEPGSLLYNDEFNYSFLNIIPALGRKYDGNYNTEIGLLNILWTNSEEENDIAINRGLFHNRTDIYRSSVYKNIGHSVRCIYDDFIVEGCSDELACNYDKTVNFNDGSCIYPEENLDCDDNPIVIDLDGNIYSTIQIGEQIWMAENLEVTHYKNGDEITFTSCYESWNNIDNGLYCYDEDLPEFIDRMGNYYNGHVILDERGVCPDGWHIPSQTEFRVLADFLGGEDVAGYKMKEVGNEHWIYWYNYECIGIDTADYSFDFIEHTDESNFTALPAGEKFNWYDNSIDQEVGLISNRGGSTSLWTLDDEFSIYCSNIDSNDNHIPCLGSTYLNCVYNDIHFFFDSGLIHPEINNAKPIRCLKDSSWINGDINLDNQINIADIVLLVQYILGNTEFSITQEDLSDFNQDGDVNIADIVQIVQYILNS